jgi:predicted RND superfamily exporter protein
MIWILLLVALIMIGVGFALLEGSYNFQALGGVLMVIGIVIAIVLSIFAIVLTCCCVDTIKIKEKIEMYETENTKIEEQMTLIVQKYMEHEQKVFDEVTEKNVMSYIALYPELRSDSLVSKQMKIYYNNHEKITKLKEEQIMAPIYRWWVYFGK